MFAPPRFRVIILLTALLISTALATTPDDNDIPTLAMRIRGPDASYKTDFPLELLCELSWLSLRCNDTARPPQPIDVRIGWVRLEESAP